MKKNLLITATLVLSLFTSCAHKMGDAIAITVYTDSIVSDISNHPVGINLNFIMDGGRFPKAKKNVTEAVKELGTKYLRYPGGEKSDLYFSAYRLMKNHILHWREQLGWMIIPEFLKMESLFMTLWISMNS